jgi:hypothetical protein
MEKIYEPELGQAAFGQPYKQYEVPEIGLAALRQIANEYDRVMHNLGRGDEGNPFDNSGARFDCDEFSAHAYSWGDDDHPWNFKWKDLEISWYKWSGRGTSSNIPVTPQLASDFLEACMSALLAYEKANGRDFGQ